MSAALDASSSHDLYFPTMVGGENRRENALSASAAEKQTLILKLSSKDKNLLLGSAGLGGYQELLISGVGRRRPLCPPLESELWR
jgi:hypothetical protein